MKNVGTVLKIYLKILSLIALVFVLFGTVWMEITVLHARGLSAFIEAQDFSAYYTAGQMVLHGVGKDFYDIQTQLSWQQQFNTNLTDIYLLRPFFYPPFFALLAVPFAVFPLNQAYIFWLCCNGLLLVFLYRQFLLVLISKDVYLNVVTILVICSYLPFVVTLISGQTSFLLLASLVMLRFSLVKHHKLRAGLWLSMFLLKPQYILLPLLFFVMRKEGAVLKGFGIGAGIITFFSFMLVGVDGIMNYRNFFSEVTQWNNAATMAPQYMATFRGFLQLIFQTDAFWPVLAYWLVGVMAMTCILMLSWRRKAVYKSPAFDFHYSAMIIGMIVISPWTSGQDLVLLILPAALLVFWSAKMKNRTPLFVCLLLILLGYISAIVAESIAEKMHINIHIFYLLGLFLFSFYMQRMYSKAV